jgi:DNA-binding PadR family transcriptional regulator
MSGYDLLKLVARSIGFFWTPARSQVYTELKRLSRLGLVAERRVHQEGRPDKRLYELTEGGRAALQRWLDSPEVEPDTLRSQFLLRLFFGHLAGRERTLDLVRRRRRDAERTLATLREVEPQVAGNPDLLYPYLTLLSGVAHSEATLRWAEDVIRRLEEDQE